MYRTSYNDMANRVRLASSMDSQQLNAHSIRQFLNDFVIFHHFLARNACLVFYLNWSVRSHFTDSIAYSIVQICRKKELCDPEVPGISSPHRCRQSTPENFHWAVKRCVPARRARWKAEDHVIHWVSKSIMRDILLCTHSLNMGFQCSKCLYFESDFNCNFA